MTTPTDQELEKVARRIEHADDVYQEALSALKQVQPTKGLGVGKSTVEVLVDSIAVSPQEQQSDGLGIALIAAERLRQVSEEGWTPEHDNTHNRGELALLAVYYALDESQRKEWSKKTGRNFSADWLKPTPHDRVRELIKAGALIAAEIDRLKRVPPPASTPANPPKDGRASAESEKVAREFINDLEEHRCLGEQDERERIISSLTERIANCMGRVPNIDTQRLDCGMDNVLAWRLGAAAREAVNSNSKACGDFIDAGLTLRRLLEERGFGVFVIDKAMASNNPPAEEEK